MNQLEIKSVVKEILTECEELLTKKVPQYEIKIEETKRTQKVIITYIGGDYYFTLLKTEKKEKLISYCFDAYNYIAV